MSTANKPVIVSSWVDFERIYGDHYGVMPFPARAFETFEPGNHERRGVAQATAQGPFTITTNHGIIGRISIDFDPWARTVDLLAPLPRRYECDSCKRAVTTEDGQLPSGWVEKSKVIPGVGPLAILCTNLCGNCS